MDRPKGDRIRLNAKLPKTPQAACKIKRRRYLRGFENTIIPTKTRHRIIMKLITEEEFI
jgi:hypothetical protein